MTVVDLSAYRLRRRVERDQLVPAPYVLTAHQDAVEFRVGCPESDDGVELWLDPDQAETLGHELLRMAVAARAGVP